MRILLVSDLFPPVRGGLESHVDSLASALAVAGHETHVATMTRAPIASHSSVTVHVIPALSARLLRYEDSARTFHPPLPDPLARRTLAALVHSLQPDVVHGHSWLTVSLPRNSKSRTIYTAHDYGLICPLRTLLRPTGEICAGPSLHCLPSSAATYGWAKSALLSAATPVGRRLMGVDHVVAVSASVATAIRPHLRVPVTVVPNFIPDEDPPLSLTAAAVLPDEPYILFAGDPSPHKGIDVLLDAWSSPDSLAMPLVLAVTRDVTSALPAGVTVVRLRKEEMFTAWSRAAVAVVPSIWADPCPTVAIEAMASGTAVVATKLGGLTDIVAHGETGLLVPPGDAAALRAALLRLIHDQELCSSLGRNGSERSRQFRVGAVLPQLLELYGMVREPA